MVEVVTQGLASISVLGVIQDDLPLSVAPRPRCLVSCVQQSGEDETERCFSSAVDNTLGLAWVQAEAPLLGAAGCRVSRIRDAGSSWQHGPPHLRNFISFSLKAF